MQVNRIFLLIFFIGFLLISKAHPQNDTIFYNSNWQETKNRDSTTYYRLTEYDKEKNIYIVRDFYKTGTIQMYGEYSSLDPKVRHGRFVWYDKNGSYAKEYYYVNEKEAESVVDYIIADEKPEFPGGEMGLLRYIGQKTVYPEALQGKGIKGRVYVSYVISETGKVINVKVNKGVHPDLDKEAVKVIESMPDWKPGRYNGKNVAVALETPIKFTLIGVGETKPSHNIVDNKTAKEYFTKGDSCYAKKNYNDAVKNYDKAIKKSRNAKFFFARSKAKAELGDYSGAMNDIFFALDASEKIKDKIEKKAFQKVCKLKNREYKEKSKSR